MSIFDAFMDMRRDGEDAISEAQKIQSALETLLEIGSPVERKFVQALLEEVNRSITVLFNNTVQCSNCGNCGSALICPECADIERE